MTEEQMKNLNTQLNNLKNLKPSSDWKSRNRELLLTQIYNSADAKPADFSFGFFAYFQQVSSEVINIMAQPAIVVGLVLLSLIGGGTFGAVASRGTKPGDSLYIAKIVSEKTQLALTFSEMEKAKLRIDFAGNRAEEIDQVLAVENVDNDEQVKTEKKQTVDNLVVSLKKEVGAAKTGLQKISKNANIDTKSDEGDEKKSDVAENNDRTVAQKEEDEVFSANLGKENTGISVSEKVETNKVVVKEVVKIEEDSKTLLTQAKESLKSDDVASTLSVLEKIDEAIDKTVDSGEVKGVEEETVATTTVEVK